VTPFRSLPRKDRGAHRAQHGGEVTREARVRLGEMNLPLSPGSGTLAPGDDQLLIIAVGQFGGARSSWSDNDGQDIALDGVGDGH